MACGEAKRVVLLIFLHFSLFFLGVQVTNKSYPTYLSVGGGKFTSGRHQLGKDWKNAYGV